MHCQALVEGETEEQNSFRRRAPLIPARPDGGSMSDPRDDTVDSTEPVGGGAESVPDPDAPHPPAEPSEQEATDASEGGDPER